MTETFGLDDQLARYAELVRTCPHNLLSPRGLAELETRHIPESLAFAHSLPAGPDVVDVGPGGGLPGVVVAIARPDLRLTMVEATRKKATFLTETAHELGLDIDVRHGRIEEFARGEFAGRFDLAIARAVAALETLVPWVVPALRPGGELWAIKGERWTEEVEAARGALQQVGASVVGKPSSTGGATTAAAGPTVVTIRRDTGARDAR